MSFSIGYTGLDTVKQSDLFNISGACRVKVAQMTNKAGALVSASVDSAQSAVRSKVSTLIDRSICPGFGMCADVNDPDDPDVWPMTAMTVNPSEQILSK